MKITILPFITASAYKDGANCSDYALDMMRSGLSELKNVQVQQVPENPIMFKDCPESEIRKSWGSGMTLYGLLDRPTYSFPIEDSDLIIIALHWTGFPYVQQFYNYVKHCVDSFPNIKFCVIDGQDNPYYADEIANLCPYFKRELMDDRTTAYPLFFAIPESKFNIPNTPKVYDFSPMIPANYSWDNGNCEHLKTYIYKTEKEYYLQYRQSYFAYLCKKGGFFTGRTLEVIANGCCPFFTDIEKYPKNIMHNFPKELAIQAKKLKGVYPGTINDYNPEVDTYIGDTRQIKPGDERGYIDWNIFDVQEYFDITEEIRQICQKTMTTKALAKYVLEKVM